MTSRWWSATSPTTPLAGAWCSRTPPWTTCASGTRHGGRDRAGLQPLGRHRTAFQGRDHPLGRPWLCGHRAQEAAQHPAGALRGAGRGAGVRDRRADSDERLPRRRPDHRQRRHQLPHPHPVRDVFKPDIVVRPNRYIWLGTTSCTTPSPSCSRRPSTAGSRPTSTSSTTTPPPSSSNAPSTSGRPTGWTRPTRRQSIAFCEEAVRRQPAGRQADDQCAPPARLGLAELPARQVRTVVASTAAATWC
jgi:hypothetical protein